MLGAVGSHVFTRYGLVPSTVPTGEARGVSTGREAVSIDAVRAPSFWLLPVRRGLRAGGPSGKDQESWMGDEAETVESTSEQRLRAVIADDDPFARRVIKSALSESGVLVIAEARNGREAVELALYYRPDVVVLDIVMPELDGILATRQILKAIPDQARDRLDRGRRRGRRAGPAGSARRSGRLPQQGRRHQRAAADAEGAACGRGRHLAAAGQARDRAAAQRTRRLLRDAPGQEPADGARMGGHRPPQGDAVDGRDRGRPRALDRDGPLARQEQRAQAALVPQRRGGDDRERGRARPRRRGCRAGGPRGRRSSRGAPWRAGRRRTAALP